MLQDARGIPRGAQLACDICIVGAGAAGITLARELAGTDARVCLLESGGFAPDEATQRLYEGVGGGTLLGPESRYLAAGRLRYFGGTTNHWQGWCRPLDPIDFTHRPWIPDSGWPFDRAHLDPFYRRAYDVLQLAPSDDQALLAAAGAPPLLHGSERVLTRLYYLKPTRLGPLYRQELTAARNVRLLLHANALAFRPPAAGEPVERVDVATLEGNRFAVHARWFVLAAGGIENPRLLLLSNEVQEAGLGNEHDLVGRYFMDHPHLDAGHALLFRPEAVLDLYRPHWSPAAGSAVAAVLCFSEQVQREQLLPNLSFSLPELDPTDRPDLAEQVEAAASALDRFGSAAGPTSAGEPPTASLVTLAVRAEPIPNRESRVTLIDRVDALGQRRVKLRWRLAREDRRHIRRGTVALGQELGRHARGRVHVLFDRDALWRGAYGGNHHLGTTRMHRDPKQGVVDAQCRLHGTPNLFVAGSSLFPTAGFANPTLTLIALALRLGDHLKSLLGS
jgi:choline dehydrogenase-like flavoprotein